MKKSLFVSGISLAAVLCAAGAVLSIHNAMLAKADGPSGEDVRDAILAWKDEGGTYTKKTQIFLNEEAREDMADVFHARHNVLERTTYYDETTNALLMGDYDGGFDTINSGYRKDGDNMKHYRYTGDNSSTADYYTAVKDDYTVANTSPNAYFVNLSGLATAASDLTTWTTDGSSYKYYFGDITLVNGEYNDPFLKAVQYFAAPMLLQNTEYFTPEYVQIRACTDWLSIRLYVNAEDNGKLTVYDDGNGLLAEARVFKGLVAEETSRWELRGGWGTGYWGHDEAIGLTYYAAPRETEQYCVTATINKYTQFKVVDNLATEGGWYGTGALEDGIKNLFYWHEGGNIETTATREYTFYWKGSAKTLWMSAALTFNLVLPDEWDAYPNIGIYAWCDGWTTEATSTELSGGWPGTALSRSDSMEVTINGMANKLIIVGLDGDKQKVVQTQNLEINDAITTVTVDSENHGTVA